MADDKRGRDKQARDAKRRQQARDLATELERREETEPPIDDAELDEFEEELERLEFPATGAEVVAAVGDREVDSLEGTFPVAELIPDTDVVIFEAPAAVRARVQRPTVAAAMKRIVEAADTYPKADFDTSQREAYEKTVRELKAIDADDEDEGVRYITDWIVEKVHDKEQLPGSRAVRREAAKFCRQNGYQVRNDDWLGI
ncbi:MULTISPECIES: hypothetical protein [Salinibaculum]|uniref:DUF5789 family protein n=1 Tax=Salinibaculum TaxID=2732368 RepID=UPI0030D1FF50